jgi:hypothetical protein
MSMLRSPKAKVLKAGLWLIQKLYKTPLSERNFTSPFANRDPCSLWP